MQTLVEPVYRFTPSVLAFQCLYCLLLAVDVARQAAVGEVEQVADGARLCGVWRRGRGCMQSSCRGGCCSRVVLCRSAGVATLVLAVAYRLAAGLAVGCDALCRQRGGHQGHEACQRCGYQACDCSFFLHQVVRFLIIEVSQVSDLLSVNE